MVKRKTTPYFKTTWKTAGDEDEGEEEDNNIFEENNIDENIHDYATGEDLFAAIVANMFASNIGRGKQSKPNRRGGSFPAVYSSMNDYYTGGYSTYTGYTDNIRFNPEKTAKKSQRKKVSTKKVNYDHQKETLDTIPDFIIIGLYLLLYPTKMSKQSLLYYYREYLSNFVNKEKIDQASHTFLAFKGITNTKETLLLNYLAWEAVLKENYKRLFIRLTTAKNTDMFTYPLTSLQEVDHSIPLAPLITKTIALSLKEGKIVTQNGELLAKVVKQLVNDLPRLLPEKSIPDYFLTRLIEYIYMIILACKFITFTNEDTVSVEEPFFTFITLPPEEQQIFLQEKLYTLLKDAGTDQRLPVNLSYDHLALYNYLNTYLKEPIRQNSKDKSCIILRAELLLDVYHARIERGDYVPQLRFKESDIDLITNDYRPKMSNYYNPDYPTLKLRLEHVLHFELALGGLVHPLVNDDTTVIAYKFLPPATKPAKTSSSHKADQSYKNKGIVLADFTIKIEAKTIDPKVLIRWLKYTELVTLDTIIELKITKQSVWKYLEQDTVTSLIKELNEFSETRVPQNVESSIQSWAKQYGYVQLLEGVTVTIPDPMVIDALLKNKALQEQKIIRLSPTVIIFHPDAQKKIMHFIEKQGYHIKKVNVS